MGHATEAAWVLATRPRDDPPPGRACAVSWHHRVQLHTTAGVHTMATYIVFTRESTQDQGELDTYMSKVGETFKACLSGYHPNPLPVVGGNFFA
jgi:hypothetical protein